jgi:LacI family transcriptional regulator
VAYCHIAEDQVATGALAGKAIAEKVAAKYGDGETVKSLTIGAYRGEIIGDPRDDGFHKRWAAAKSEPKVAQLPLRKLDNTEFDRYNVIEYAIDYVMDRPTYSDIARHAGVSTASVSRALANEKGVGPEVAERVRRSAAAVGYRGNHAARALRRQRSDAIGLVVSDVENPFFAAIAHEVEVFARRRQHAVLLCNTDESVEYERWHLNRMIGESVEGVIAVPSREDPGPLLELRAAGIPTVIIDRRLEGDPFDTVLVDHRGGARELVEHVLGHGHTHIGAITTTTTDTGGRERLGGCRDAVEAHDGRLTALEAETSDIVGVARAVGLGERLARQLMQLAEPPTAIFCTNNLLSLGALRGLRASGIRVPQDVALVGFDDVVSFDLLDPPLTVAAQPTEEIARGAASLLYERIAEPDRRPRVAVMPAELRIRRSCGCPYDVMSATK